MSKRPRESRDETSTSVLVDSLRSFSAISVISAVNPLLFGLSPLFAFDFAILLVPRDARWCSATTMVGCSALTFPILSLPRTSLAKVSTENPTLVGDGRPNGLHFSPRFRSVKVGLWEAESPHLRGIASGLSSKLVSLPSRSSSHRLSSPMGYLETKVRLSPATRFVLSKIVDGCRVRIRFR